MKEYMSIYPCGFGKIACFFSDHPDLSGKIQYLSPKGIRVALFSGSTDSDPILRIKKAGLREFFKFLPIKTLLLFPSHIPPYHVFDPGDEIGKAVDIFNRRTYTFFIHGSTYTLCRHSHNVGSLKKDGIPLARFTLHLKRHQVQIDYAEQSDCNIIFAFSLLFYAAFHANEHQYHTTIFFKDNYSEILEWDFDH